MTIRLKLMMVSIAVILVANSVLSLVGVRYLGSVWLNEVQTRVRRNLSAARAAYESRLDRMVYFLRAVAVDAALKAALEKQDDRRLAEVLQEVYRAGGMDYVSLLDAEGKVVYRANNPARSAGDLSANPVIALVRREQKPFAGTLVLRAEELRAEGDELAARARLELIDTPAAYPTDEKSRSDGLVLAAAVPVLGPRGHLAGILYAGDLLNQRYEIVDSIKQQVFPRESYQGRDIGTVTIFLGDVRISTNVVLEDGSRAIGTRLSAPVYDAVCVRGETWAAPAFVVNDWYITAYEPIRDPNHRIVGVLYVGLLQEPFVYRLRMITGVFLAIVVAATAASLGLLLVATHWMLRPIGPVVAMSQRIIAGDLSARVGIRPPGEVGILCQAIDSMAEAIAQREEQLKRIARQQIGQSEKLASLGRLAAGVAHEINNPLTGVLTFAHLLRQKPNMDEQDKQDLDLIIHETSRVAEIVRGLLDFARERPATKQPLDINDVVQRTLRLLSGQKGFQQIMVVEELKEDLPKVEGDVNQLQQLLLNLALNACEAMPNGGTLLVTTSARDGKVVIEVTDTGCGIKREHLDRIFEPFFTTKPLGKGTGLGLSVSYGIVQQHGGTLEVRSEEGKGTTFTIVLPAVSAASAPARKHEEPS